MNNISQFSLYEKIALVFFVLVYVINKIDVINYRNELILDSYRYSYSQEAIVTQVISYVYRLI